MIGLITWHNWVLGTKCQKMDDLVNNFSPNCFASNKQTPTLADLPRSLIERWLKGLMEEIL
jgi:hypothetical protein